MFSDCEKSQNNDQMRIILPDSYDREKGNFFINITKKIHSWCLKLNARELILFYIISADYLLDIDIFTFYTCNICRDYDYELGLEVFNEIIKQIAGPKYVPNIDKLFKYVCEKIKSEPLNISAIEPESLTLASGRHIICDILRSQHFNDEVSLLNSIIAKIKMINKNATIKLSLKGLYDIFACIKWVDVGFTVFNSYLVDILEMYPKFVIPDKMNRNLIRRTKCIASYDKKDNKIFKFNPKMHSFDSRCGYEKTFRIGDQLDIYTTTETPKYVLISVSSYVPKKDASKMIMVMQTGEDTLFVAFTLKYININGESRSIHKNWKFTKKLTFDVGDATSPFEIIFHKAFFDVDPAR